MTARIDRFKRLRVRVVFLAFVTVCVALPSSAKAAEPVLRLEGDPTITIDPVCGVTDATRIDLTLRTSQTTRVALASGVVTSKTAGAPFNATVALEVLKGPTPEPSGAIVLKPDGPDDTLTFRVSVRGTSPQGEWETPLLNLGLEFAKVKIVNPHVGSGLNLGATATDGEQVSFERHRNTPIALKNDDDVPYTVAWAYTVEGETTCGSARQASNVDCDSAPLLCDLTVLAHGVAEVRILPLDSWFRTEARPAFELFHPLRSLYTWLQWAGPRVKGLLKSEILDGRLTLRPCSPQCSAKQGAGARGLKVRTQLSAFSKDGQSVGGFAVLFVTLLAGGLTSLLVNFTLPIQARRLRVRIDSLKPIDESTRFRWVSIPGFECPSEWRADAWQSASVRCDGFVHRLARR